MAEEHLTFDDVLIVPSYSDIDSRSEIDTSVNFLGMDLSVPIVSANMDFVTGAEMVNAMHGLGGFGILHRFHEDDRAYYEEAASISVDAPIWLSVGIRDLDASIDFIKWMQTRLNVYGICIDVAHGHHAKVGTLVERVKGSVEPALAALRVIAGNVATAEGVAFLANSGADAVKVGIGAGSVCTTRTVAGVGIPQWSAILECTEIRDQEFPQLEIIADGGVRSSGDIAKALATGADVVMLGNMLAGTDEAPGEIEERGGINIVGPGHPTQEIPGQKYKRYRGQASFGTNGDKYVKEGIEGLVPYKGPVEPIITGIKRGLQSSMSYVGARNLQEFADKAKFVQVSSHTLIESGTRVTEY
jgi:IMP dehydrogenase